MPTDDDDFEVIKKLWDELNQGLRDSPLETPLVTHVDLGLAYLDMGLLDDAESEFNLVLSEVPAHPTAFAALELVRRRRGGRDRDGDSAN